MEKLIEDGRKALKCEAWYAALITALTIPDICGFVENPAARSGQRYADWFAREVASRYRSQRSDGSSVQFLSGNDCYALRCAFLHQGEFDITSQRAREALEKFHFLVPPKGFKVHDNRIGDALQLQVSVFCEDIFLCAENWLKRVHEIDEQRTRIRSLAHIQVALPGQAFSF